MPVSSLISDPRARAERARAPRPVLRPGTSIFLAVAAVALLLSPWLAQLEGGARVAAFAVPVLALGLPHGAMDTSLARSLGLWRGPAGLIVFIAAYVALAAATLALWLAFPGPVLAALLAVSALHFAGDWGEGAGDPLGAAYGVVGGVAVIGWPALWHGPEVAAIFALLSTPEAGEALQGFAASLGALALPALAATALARAWTARAPSSTVADWRSDHAALELGALALLAWALPPLLFFAVYFCALHAPRHVRTIAARHDAALRTGRMATALGTLAGVVLVAALALAPPDALAALWGRDGEGAVSPLVGAVFMALLALTVPHMALETLAERIEERSGA